MVGHTGPEIFWRLAFQLDPGCLGVGDVLSSMRPSTTSTTTLADDATDEDIAAFAEQLGGEIQSRMQIPGAHQNLLETVSFIQFYATFFNFLGPQFLRCH